MNKSVYSKISYVNCLKFLLLFLCLTISGCSQKSEKDILEESKNNFCAEKSHMEITDTSWTQRYADGTLKDEIMKQTQTSYYQISNENEYYGVSYETNNEVLLSKAEKGRAVYIRGELDENQKYISNCNVEIKENEHYEGKFGILFRPVLNEGIVPYLDYKLAETKNGFTILVNVNDIKGFVEGYNKCMPSQISKNDTSIENLSYQLAKVSYEFNLDQDYKFHGYNTDQVYDVYYNNDHYTETQHREIKYSNFGKELLDIDKLQNIFSKVEDGNHEIDRIQINDLVLLYNID